MLTNKHIRVQSQVRCPTVDDVKTVIHEMSKEQRPALLCSVRRPKKRTGRYPSWRRTGATRFGCCWWCREDAWEHALLALLYADDGNLLDGTDTAPISAVGALLVIEALVCRLRGIR